MSVTILYGLETKRLVLLWLCLCFLLSVIISPFTAGAETPAEEITFDIKGFAIKGNTLFSRDDILPVLKPFSGQSKTARDVEQARDALERFYHQEGYPAVLVNIPEQTVESGIVRFEVVESEIRRIRITGNRYFTMETILEDLPSLSPGNVLYIPDLQRELAVANRNPDLKISPMLIPGKTMDTIDVELQVEDQLPLHGNLELNNRGTHSTTNLRLNGTISYDNLWQAGHSISLQYQTAPKDTDEVQTVAVSYVLPTPWNPKNLLALYGILSDSETAFGSGFNVVGEGTIIGGRYVIPLPAKGRYAHNVTLGLDYKDFDEELGFETGEDAVYTPITYLPFSISYSSSLPDKTGTTQFSFGVNMAFRGLVTDQREFEVKRFQATGNYLYATAGVERTQTLPWDFSLFGKIDGQLANQPLISNEQYTAGGMKSVRGYKETEEVGDDAFHATLEVRGPDVAASFVEEGAVSFVPYLHYDMAALRTQDPLPGEESSTTIQGAGFGVRGGAFDRLEYEVIWSQALESTSRTDSGDVRFHFQVRYVF